MYALVGMNMILLRAIRRMELPPALLGKISRMIGFALIADLERTLLRCSEGILLHEFFRLMGFYCPSV